MKYNLSMDFEQLFSGRLSRTHYSLGIFILYVILVGSVSFLTEYFSENFFALLICFLLMISSPIFLTSLVVRRGHDLNYSGTRSFILMVLILPLWIFIIMGAKNKKTYIDNDFGKFVNDRQISFKGIFLNKWE